MGNGVVCVSESAFVRGCSWLNMGGAAAYANRTLGEQLGVAGSVSHRPTVSASVPASPYRRQLVLKRWLDLVVLVVLLPLIVLIIGVVAASVRLFDGAPVFFSQRRVGCCGRSFILYKFRTMRVQRSGADNLSAAVTRADDCRVTGLGRLLRRARLDELPQVWNIVRGEMSWIGPRPDSARLARHYEQTVPGYRNRYAVPPGLSGWAQVNQGYVAGERQVRRKVAYDLYYIRHFSVWLDTLIAIRTIPVMLTGWGAR